jgi:homogentisate 1,2-dioxygenase
MTLTIEERRARDRAYYQANKEAKKAKQRAYYQAHKEEINARNRAVRKFRSDPAARSKALADVRETLRDCAAKLDVLGHEDLEVEIFHLVTKVYWLWREAHDEWKGNHVDYSG